jgi:hypothetical protein
MTTLHITLLSLLGIQWVAAYFVNRWQYRTTSGIGPGFGFLWIPGIGFALGILIGIFLLFETFDSDGFKDRFYGRHKRPEPEAQHASVSDMTNTMVDMYTCHGLISDASDFGTAAKAWRDTYASNPL